MKPIDPIFLYIMFVVVTGFLFYICILLIDIADKLEKKGNLESEDYRRRSDK